MAAILLMESVGSAPPIVPEKHFFKSPDGGVTLIPLSESELKAFRQGPLNEDRAESQRAAFLIESKESDGFLYVEGPFGECEKKNGNGRIYERELWESVSSSGTIVERMGEGDCKGHLEHPANGRTDLNLVSHVLVAHPKSKTKTFWIDEQGVVHGRSRILNTSKGKDLQELFRGGAKVGISSRGKGSTYKKRGAEYVSKDYVFDTFDFVATPSVAIANPKPVHSEALSSQDAPAAESALLRNHRDPLEESMDKLQELKVLEGRVREVAGRVDSADALGLAQIRDEILESQVKVRRIVESDPTVRDLGDTVGGKFFECRTKVEKRLETMTDKSLEERAKQATVAGVLNEGSRNGVDVVDTMQKLNERVAYYRSKAEELADSTKWVPRAELEASMKLIEGLVEKCKVLQTKNKEISEQLVTESKNAQEHKPLNERENKELTRYRKEHPAALRIIEELTGRIRKSQVKHRVEELCRREPKLARVRDMMLECATVEEVNKQAARVSRLVEDERSEFNDLIQQQLSQTTAETPEGTPLALPESQQTPAPKPPQARPSQNHRQHLIGSLRGTGTFRK